MLIKINARLIHRVYRAQRRLWTLYALDGCESVLSFASSLVPHSEKFHFNVVLIRCDVCRVCVGGTNTQTHECMMTSTNGNWQTTAERLMIINNWFVIKFWISPAHRTAPWHHKLIWGWAQLWQNRHYSHFDAWRASSIQQTNFVIISQHSRARPKWISRPKSYCICARNASFSVFHFRFGFQISQFHIPLRSSQRKLRHCISVLLLRFAQRTHTHTAQRREYFL